jgi:hypothetical protein
MLREIPHVRQITGGRRRRWFQSDDEDLFVWYRPNGSIFGFQLSCGRHRDERALTWMPKRGFSHNRVDAGERDGLRYARSPMLVADGAFDASAMLRRFLLISTSLPPEIRRFVLDRLAKYPTGIRKRNA